MSALPMIELVAAGQHIAKDSDAGWLLLAGPLTGGALYAALWGFYRNTDKSHQFERTTRVDAKPVTGTDVKVNELNRTKKERVPGDNRSSHRSRVQRVG